MKKTTLVVWCSFVLLSAQAQTVLEVKGIKFYEHHSSEMTKQAFGQSANGAQSGYDFVTRKFFSSFDATTFSSYTKGEEKDLDMVEHNGPFGTQGASMLLGFTSGISTIWDGRIKGNNNTKWLKVNNGLTIYNSVASITDLSKLYDETKATAAITVVNKDDVYVGRIRKSNLYVLIKCTSTKAAFGPPTGGSFDNVWFQFDYKYTSLTASENELEKTTLAVYPNPTSEVLSIIGSDLAEKYSVSIFNLSGKEVISELMENNTISISHLIEGFYFVHIKNKDNNIILKQKIQIERK